MSRFGKKKNVANTTEYKSESGKTLAQAIREAMRLEPDDVDAQLTARTEFYREELIRRVKGHMEIKCPENWDKTYIKESLIIHEGYFCVTEKESNPLPLRCSAYGVSYCERPTNVVVANPVLGSFTREIGTDCELVYLEGRGTGFKNMHSLLDVYSQKLASCDKAIDVNLFNTMTSLIFAVKNGKVAQAIRAMFAKISKGEPAVFIDRDTELNDPSNIISLRAKENYIADLVQIEKDKIMDEFLTAVGINNANTEKRERLITDEVNANNDEVINNAAEWNETLSDCCARVRKMFPNIGEFSVRFTTRSTVDRPKKEEVVEDGDVD